MEILKVFSLKSIKPIDTSVFINTNKQLHRCEGYYLSDDMN